MALPAGTHQLSPQNGTILVKTHREGLAQAVGHDLVLKATTWNATVVVGDDGTLSIELDVDATSLEVREGLRGVKPLTDKDRAEIKQNIDDKVLQRKPISFRSKSATGGDRLEATGDLTLGGTTREETFELQINQGRITGTVAVTQSDYGIKPYRALMGALKVGDSLEVVIDVEL
jgi:polyisoprenoid-binding protein YceI